MIKKFQILSTKTLDFHQSQVFSKNLQIVYRDFISIKPLDFNYIPQQNDLIVFTSQNAVTIVFKKNPTIVNDMVCVGEKTAKYIEHLFHKKPKIIAHSSKELAQEIIKANYPSITFFNGNLRREELPLLLLSNNIDFKEIMVYKTLLTSHTITSHFDGMIFFSPSGVESYLKKNQFSKNTLIFAIGNTTADFIKQKGSECIISERPTTESLIETVNYYFNNKK